MAAASVQRLASGLAGPSSFAAGSNRASEAQKIGVRKLVPAGFGPSKGLGSWKNTRRRAGVQCSLGVSKVFAGFQGFPKLPLGSLLGDLRENNKDVKWALDYWDQELEDGYKSLDEWKEQLSNIRQGNPTIKWAFDYWDRELEDGYKSLDEWGAALTDIRAGVWLDKVRAQNPDVKWALDYWDQELIDGYKSLDEWKAQAADIGSFFSQNPLYVALGVGALFVPILLYVKLNKGYAGNLSANEAFARLNGEDSAVLVDIRSKDEKAAQGGPKLGKKVLAVAAEGDGTLSSVEELRSAVKDRVADQGTVLVVLDSNGAAAPQAAKALTGEGYKSVYAISGGAEGPQGWRESQLPWRTPQTFTLDLGEIKDVVTSKIQEMQENIQDIPILGVAAAAGVSLILFTEAETALQLLGSAAVIQVFAKKLLFAKDREETVKQVQTFLDTEVAPQELKDDLQGLTGQLMSKAEATAEAEAAAASPVSVLSKPTSPKAEAPKEKKSASVDLEADSGATEEIPEANVPDLLKEEGKSAGEVAEASRAQAAAPAKEIAEVNSKGGKSGTVSVPEVQGSEAAESVAPDAKAEDVLKSAEAEIPEANLSDVLSEDSAEGVGAKAEDVLGAAEAEIPEANLSDVLSEDSAEGFGAKAEDVKAAAAETPKASVADIASEGPAEGADAKSEDILGAAEAEIPEANVEDVASEVDSEGITEPAVAAKESEDGESEDVSGKGEGVSAVAEDKEEKTEVAGEGLRKEDANKEAKSGLSSVAPGPAAVVEPVQGLIGDAVEGAKETAEGVQEGAKSVTDSVKSKAEELAAAAAQKIDTGKGEEEPAEEASTSSDTSAFGQVAGEGSEVEVSDKSEEVGAEGEEASAETEEVSAKTEEVSEKATEAAGDLQEKVGKAVEKVKEPAAKLTKKGKRAAKDAARKAKRAASKTGNAVSKTGDVVSDAFSETGGAVSKAGDVVSETGNVVSDAVSKTGDAASETGGVVSKGREAVSEVVSVPEEEVKELVVEPASGALETVGEAEAAVEENGAAAITAEEQQPKERVGELGAGQKEDGKEQNGAAVGDGKKVDEATRAIKQAFAPGTQTSPAEPGVITLLYDSGWENAFIHFSADGGTWTELPGVPLGFDKKEQVKAIRIPASSIQFVLTNGIGDWDRAPYGDNYSIGSSGTYRLSFGTISQVSKVGK